MKYAIDETELARLEELAGKASKMPFFPDDFDVQDDFDQIVCRCNGVNDLAEDVQEANAHYIAAACNAVPALVAEVRRLREKVEAWEWFEEVRTYDPWREHPYWTACGLASHLHKDQNFIGTKRARAFENAITEWQAILACSTRGRLC